MADSPLAVHPWSTDSVDRRPVPRTITRIGLEDSSRRSATMSLGVSLFLLVVGAVLTFAVDVTTSGFSLHTVGIIPMVAGALGVVLSLLFWSSFSPYRRGDTVVGGDTVVEERHVRRDLP